MIKLFERSLFREGVNLIRRAIFGGVVFRKFRQRMSCFTNLKSSELRVIKLFFVQYRERRDIQKMIIYTKISHLKFQQMEKTMAIQTSTMKARTQDLEFIYCVQKERAEKIATLICDGVVSLSTGQWFVNRSKEDSLTRALLARVCSLLQRKHLSPAHDALYQQALKLIKQYGATP